MKNSEREKRRKESGLYTELGHKIKSLMTVILVRWGAINDFEYYKTDPILASVFFNPQPEITQAKGGE